MIRHWIFSLGAPILATAALLFGAEPGLAQRGGGHGGGGHGGGGYSGGGYHGGYYGGGYHGGYYGGGYYGGYHPGYGHSYGYYPWYGYGWGYPYRSYYYNYGPGYYSAYPYDYSDYYGYNPSATDYQAFYPPTGDTAAAAPTDNRVLMNIRVQPNAQLWIMGNPTSQTGGFRQFISPPLTPGSDYTYQLRARWMENGQAVEQTQDVTVRAGSQVNVDFTRPTATR